MAKKEIRVKVVPTKAGDVWDSTKTYALLDYITLSDGVIYVSKKAGNVGHALTETDWWDKTIDLSGYIASITAATSSATVAAEGASKVNALLGEDNVLTITDRTGAKKTANIGTAVDTARIKESLGPYTEREDIVLTALQNGYVVNSSGQKEAKSGWAMAQFKAELGNEYLFNPGVTDGSVCVFAELIDKVETRGIDYVYTYDENGRMATAKATYDGKTHSYTFAYTAMEGQGEGSEVVTITDDQTGMVIDYLPITYKTTVGSYQPLTLLNADAELPEDGYCRFVSNFQARASINVVVSYKVGSADLTMKVVRDGMTASMCTQLSRVNQKVDEAKENIEAIMAKQDASVDYYVGEHDDVTGDPHFKNCKGNKDVLDCWHPYLIDTTDNTRMTTKPVGRLMDNNYFRFANGSYAPTVGITEAQRAACDVQLYTDAEHTQMLTLNNGTVVTAKGGAHPYDAVEVYENFGLIDLYDENGEKVRQLLPWETTETKYTIGLAADYKLYLVDRQESKSGAMISGVFRRPMTYDGIDTGRFCLARTAISPGPVTTVGGKTRNFFYDYAAGDTNTKNGVGYSNLCSMYVDGRTYPRTEDVQQIRNMTLARANNSDAERPYPFAEGGFHAWNTWLSSMELLYGTKFLHDNALFGSGISSNDACKSYETWRTNGGVRYREHGTDDWTYAQWGSNAMFGTRKNDDGTIEKRVIVQYINNYRPHEQCMESQMAASWAVEFGIAEGDEYEAYGATYRYSNIAGVDGLDKGRMNCKVYRLKMGSGNGYKDADTLTDYDIECMHRVSLIGGMNYCGDIFVYKGGGMEMVGTAPKNYKEIVFTDKYIDFYMEDRQERWEYDNSVVKAAYGRFGFESVYPKIGTFGPPILNNGYYKSRMGYTPYATENGGSIKAYQCAYAWGYPYWAINDECRYRLAVRVGARSYYASCCGRCLDANNALVYAHVAIGGSAQCLIE